MHGISSQSDALSTDFKIETSKARKARVCRTESGKSSGSSSRVSVGLSHDSGSTVQSLSNDSGFIVEAVGFCPHVVAVVSSRPTQRLRFGL